MAQGNDRLDRIERILEESTVQHAASMARIDQRLEYMAARQQYHDEAFERFDADMKLVKEAQERHRAAQERDSENIRALIRIAEMHNRRLENLGG